MHETNAVMEGKYSDSKFRVWPNPNELKLDKIIKDRTTVGNICWFYFEKLYYMLSNAPKGRVLDLACGAGLLSINLARAGHSVVGIDISEKAIEYAKSLAAIHHCSDKIEFIVMDASKLTFPENYFDIITGEDCLHHILKYPGTMEGMYRVLKPDGNGYFFEPFGFNPVVNVLRLINLKVSKREFEAVLTSKEVEALNKTFDKVIISDLSVIYKIPRCISRFTSNHRNLSIRLRNADIALQKALPFMKKFYSAAFIELRKSDNKHLQEIPTPGC